MTTKEQFKLHLEAQTTRKTGRASSYVRALNLLSEMLAGVPKGFADCVDIWNVRSVSRWQELYEVANAEKHLGAKNASNPSFPRTELFYIEFYHI
jgi:putative restriction endonuclease